MRRCHLVGLRFGSACLRWDRNLRGDMPFPSTAQELVPQPAADGGDCGCEPAEAVADLGIATGSQSARDPEGQEHGWWDPWARHACDTGDRAEQHADHDDAEDEHELVVAAKPLDHDLRRALVCRVDTEVAHGHNERWDRAADAVEQLAYRQEDCYAGGAG